MTYDRRRNTGITPRMSTKHVSGKCIHVKGSFAIRVNQYPTYVHVSRHDRQANRSQFTGFDNTRVQRLKAIL